MRIVTPNKIASFILLNPFVDACSDDDLFSQFCSACNDGDLATVQQQLASVENVNALNPLFKQTPLTLSVLSQNVELVRFLLDHGADVAVRGHDGKSAVHFAVKVNRVDIVRLLVERGANPNWVNCYGFTPMESATTRECMKCLWQAGASGESTFRAAVAFGFLDIAEECIVDCVDVDTPDRDGWTPLWSQLASPHRDDAVMRFLVVCGADFGAMVSGRDTRPHGTMLTYALSRNRQGFEDLLIAAGADVNAADNSSGATPLDVAFGTDRSSNVAMLLAAGANVDAVDRSGRTPMQRTQNRVLQCLLAAAGATRLFAKFTEEQLDDSRADIAAAARALAAERLKLKRERRALVTKRALPMCFAVQERQLPAFVTLAIVDAQLGGLRDLVSMHFKWEMITAIKHFHDRAQQ